jgi:hypothetical protein
MTTRTDRLIALLSFVGTFAVLLAIGAAIGFLGAVEIVLLFLIAIPLAILVARTIRARRARLTPPPTG